MPELPGLEQVPPQERQPVFRWQVPGLAQPLVPGPVQLLVPGPVQPLVPGPVQPLAQGPVQPLAQEQVRFRESAREPPQASRSRERQAQAPLQSESLALRPRQVSQAWLEQAEPERMPLQA